MRNPLFHLGENDAKNRAIPVPPEHVGFACARFDSVNSIEEDPSCGPVFLMRVQQHQDEGIAGSLRPAPLQCQDCPESFLSGGGGASSIRPHGRS